MKQLLPLLTATLLLGACGGNERPATTPDPGPAAVNVYSHRHYDTDKALFERFTQETGIPVRAAHMGLFPHLDLAGTRQTELARRMGVSKQAVHQLVVELVGFGVLEQVRDPSDKRALLVRFTPRGARSLFDGLAVLNALEADMREELGRARMSALHDALERLNDWLDG